MRLGSRAPILLVNVLGNQTGNHQKLPTGWKKKKAEGHWMKELTFCSWSIKHCEMSGMPPQEQRALMHDLFPVSTIEHTGFKVLACHIMCLYLPEANDHLTQNEAHWARAKAKGEIAPKLSRLILEWSCGLWLPRRASSGWRLKQVRVVSCPLTKCCT